MNSVPKIVKVKVSLGRTLNTGNYSSLRLDIGYEADCTPEDHKSVLAQLYANVVKDLDVLINDYLEKVLNIKEHANG